MLQLINSLEDESYDCYNTVRKTRLGCVGAYYRTGSFCIRRTDDADVELDGAR